MNDHLRERERDIRKKMELTRGTARLRKKQKHETLMMYRLKEFPRLSK